MLFFQYIHLFPYLPDKFAHSKGLKNKQHIIISVCLMILRIHCKSTKLSHAIEHFVKHILFNITWCIITITFCSLSSTNLTTGKSVAPYELQGVCSLTFMNKFLIADRQVCQSYRSYQYPPVRMCYVLMFSCRWILRS